MNERELAVAALLKVDSDIRAKILRLRNRAKEQLMLGLKKAWHFTTKKIKELSKCLKALKQQMDNILWFPMPLPSLVGAPDGSAWDDVEYEEEDPWLELGGEG